MNRADIHWTDLSPARGSAPAKRRPVLVIQADNYNRSRLATVVVVAVTSNTAHGAMPGNVFLPADATGLARDSVANVTAWATVDRRDLDPRPAGRVPSHLMAEVDRGIRRVLGLAI